MQIFLCRSSTHKQDRALIYFAEVLCDDNDAARSAHDRTIPPHPPGTERSGAGGDGGYVLIIEGSDLVMQAMTKDEILLQGSLRCVRVATDEQ